MNRLMDGWTNAQGYPDECDIDYACGGTNTYICELVIFVFLLFMKSIQLSNLRCLTDTGEIEMKPLMVLVGANSSGKSTFLRVFPLFKQSIEARKRGPLLWFGPEVDFGSFETSISRGQDTMRFIVKYDSSSDNQLSPVLRPSIWRDIILNSLVIDIGTDNNEHDKITHLEVICFDDQEVKIDFNSNELKLDINGRLFESDAELELVSFTRFGIVPNVIINSKKEKKSVREIIQTRILKKIAERGESQAENNSVDRIFYGFYGSQTELKDRIRRLFRIKRKGDSSEILSYLNDLIIFSQIDDILESVNMLLRADFGNVSYIKPLRASAERYYRVQNLSVDELASDGHNMAMFLNELYSDRTKKAAFQKWTKDNFRFIVDTIESNGHVSIKVIDEKNGDDNLADMGSGYAQLLPIIIMLWQTTSNRPLSRLPLHLQHGKKIIAIEQPELHLHPSLQMRFADVLATILNSSKELGLCLIIETHSKEIINHLGIRVEEKVINAEDISILLFDESHKVRTAHFSNDGVLQNWPIGFFDRIYN